MHFFRDDFKEDADLASRSLSASWGALTEKLKSSTLIIATIGIVQLFDWMHHEGQMNQMIQRYHGS